MLLLSLNTVCHKPKSSRLRLILNQFIAIIYMKTSNHLKPSRLITLCATLLCTPFIAMAHEQTPLQVVVTDSIVEDWVESVGGEHVDVTTVSEQDTEAIANADIIYENGLGSEVWLDEAYEENDSAARRIVLSDGLPTMSQGSAYWQEMSPPNPYAERMPECCKGNAEEENKDWSILVENIDYTPPQNQNAVDPNLWYDINNAKTVVVTINDTLVEQDEAHADSYDANAKKYLKELDVLDVEIKAIIRKIPVKQRQLSTENDSFRYFAQRYGLIALPKDAAAEQIIIAEWSPQSTTSQPPNTILYTTIVESSNSSATSYESMMRNNAQTIAKELTQGQ